eukprot:5864496-Pyramimonas_sp.AAC.1
MERWRRRGVLSYLGSKRFYNIHPGATSGSSASSTVRLGRSDERSPSASALRRLNNHRRAACLLASVGVNACTWSCLHK